MTYEEQLKLKQWLTNEELRLAQDVDQALGYCIRVRSASAAVSYFRAVIVYEEFRRCMRSLDMLLHIYP